MRGAMTQDFAARSGRCACSGGADAPGVRSVFSVVTSRMARMFFCKDGRAGCDEQSFSPTCDLPSLAAAERGRCRGFTLLELLIVVGIIGILLVLIVPAFTTIRSGTDVTRAIYGVKGVLENARVYAKANHTYVFVGFAEVDSSVDPAVSPQVTTGPTSYGRVALAVVASKDGMRHFQYATS